MQSLLISIKLLHLIIITNNNKKLLYHNCLPSQITPCTSNFKTSANKATRNPTQALNLASSWQIPFPNSEAPEFKTCLHHQPTCSSFRRSVVRAAVAVHRTTSILLPRQPIVFSSWPIWAWPECHPHGFASDLSRGRSLRKNIWTFNRLDICYKMCSK